ARVTRIAKGYLIALEEEAFEKLPSETYAKGFLRSYAGFLCVPPEELLARFQDRVTGETPEDVGSVPAKGRTEMKKGGSPKQWFSAFAAIGLILVLVIIFRGGRMKSDFDSTQVDPQHLPVAEKAAHLPLVQLPLSSERMPGNSARIPKESTETSAEKSPAAVNGVILRIKALEDGSLDLTIDDAIYQHYDLKAGDLIEWKAEKVFVLELGNSGGVEAELNGRLLKPFGEKGTPSRIVLSAEYDGEKTDP
ncbi:MAG TPA: DUF4115 domain-containing protein, partial [Geobacteraceae bacterium]|nr:DUF4115 domain-containing protein [Geobacteraceae bacterium]